MSRPSSGPCIPPRAERRSLTAQNSYWPASLAGVRVEALRLSQVIVELDPRLVILRQVQGALLMKLERHEEAREVFEAALELDPDDEYTLGNLGAVLSELGHPDEALAHLDRALALSPAKAFLNVNRGACLAARGQPTGCPGLRERHQARLPGNPSHIEAFSTATRPWRSGMERLRVLGLMLSSSPNSPDAHTRLGLAFEHLGRLDEAIAAHHRAIALGPSDPDSHWNLAFSHRVARRTRDGHEGIPRDR